MTSPIELLSRHFVGFDDFFNSPSIQQSSYPPYNIIKFNDDQTRIEMALAGFSKEDLEVTLENNSLTVSARRKQDDQVDGTYVFRGISARAFVRRWTLGRYFEVSQVKFEDGILKIDVVRNVPEDQKPRQLEIL